jgi:hypothetical protein
MRALMDAYSAVHSTRAALETFERANVGIIDHVGFLETEKTLEQALAEQRQAHAAYDRHRQQHHR